ncbi:MAG: OmpA family protein [Bacteroidetes bacterium]|nr:OmpA family protein [Bacteroidota bacterium]
MKKIIFGISVIIFSCIGVIAFTQNVDFTKENFSGKEEGLKDAQSAIKKGDELFKAGVHLYNRALEFYLKANDFNSENAELNYKIGVCYLYSSFKQKAVPHLEKARKLNSEVNDKLYYYLGRGYHLAMQWDKAITNFDEYKKRIAGSEEEKTSDADKKIQECKNGIELMKDTLRMRKLPDSLRYHIVNMGAEVNSQFPDYRPVISADESVLIFTARRDNTSGGGVDPYDGKYYEDIYISNNEKGNWTESKNLGDPINTSNRHDATCGISVDGQTLFIYLDDTYTGSGNIYECKLDGHNWSEPKKLPSTINTRYHESSASLSPDGKTLYFCSENPLDNKGLGLHDIFKSAKDEKGEWGAPENLGDVINTEYDERTVFIHPDGKTLYFSSQGHNSMGGFDLFKSVYNDSLKKWSAPVNLGYPVNSPDDDVDFVVSASGKHGYYATIRPDGFGEKDIYRITLPADTTVYLTLVKGNVTDESDNPVGSKIEIIDMKTGKLVSTQESNNATGKFLVSLPSGKNYKMKVTANGYFPHEEVFNIPRGEKFKELDVNIKLKRKEQIVDIEGTIVDEKGKALKAKIEIVNNATGEVIARTTADQLGKYLSKLKGGKNYGMTVSADGYLFQSINLDIPPDKDKMKLPPIVLKKIRANANIVLNNIFFDFDKASLRPDSKPELQRVANVLNDNPSMKIEISGHTDNKGSATYNLKLSESRAKSVIDYLIANGIEKARLSFKGYGFLKPIASNETEEGRQQNRRTEFKVTAIDENAVATSSSTETSTTTTQTQNTSTQNTTTETTTAAKLPAEIASADKNNDGRITADEIVAVIDGFFDGANDYTTEKIHHLIDFFFEQ